MFEFSGLGDLWVTGDDSEKKEISNLNPDITKKLLKLIADWKVSLPETPTGNVFSKERNSPAKNTKLN